MEDSPLVKAALQVKPLRTTATPLNGAELWLLLFH
jgi:hypothetical protein